LQLYAAFALSGRKQCLVTTQGVALGLVLLGFQPVSTVQLKIKKNNNKKEQ